MHEFYIALVALLMLLAIMDLVVGVSNDAVNFLNSAVGSKVAPFYIIMIVASAGIFLGSIFSNGMMEIARSGIFQPDKFMFSEVMVIFVAVMLTDIVLLDVFNTYGMPTSTTVSIIFELLGASIMVAFLKPAQAGVHLFEYINFSSVGGIISGIFLSIGIAFTVGTLVQYIARLLFTFEFEKRPKWMSVFYAALAATLMTYFLLVKGLKGTAFVTKEMLNFINHELVLILVLLFGFWFLVMSLLDVLLKVNVLRFIVLFGTFCLAMAFAGNDLVNFIGVSVAGLESFQAWSGSGISPDSFAMVPLLEPVKTSQWILMGAGLIMVLTLWFSKKARTVTETEVKLGSQDDSIERFPPTNLSRWIVRGVRKVYLRLTSIFPQDWKNKANRSFSIPVYLTKKTDSGEIADFDTLRASVNLLVASSLIALATSFKLPLSTTYVSFMVAMGTSLSDRAWGRDTAVYRVSGVLNVIGGWLLTALIAFLVSACFAWINLSLGVWGLIVSLVIIGSVIYFNHHLHKKRVAARKEEESLLLEFRTLSEDDVFKEAYSNASDLVLKCNFMIQQSIYGLLNEKLKPFQKTEKILTTLRSGNMLQKKSLFNSVRRINESTTNAARLFIFLYDLEQDLLQSTEKIVDECSNHIANDHKPLLPEQAEKMKEVQQRVHQHLSQVSKSLDEKESLNYQKFRIEKKQLHQFIEKLISDQVEAIRAGKTSKRNSILFITILLEIKDIIAVSTRLLNLHERFVTQYQKGGFYL